MFESLHSAYGFADPDEVYIVHAWVKGYLSGLAPRVKLHGAMTITFTVNGMCAHVSSCGCVHVMSEQHVACLDG